MPDINRRIDITLGANTAPLEQALARVSGLVSKAFNNGGNIGGMTGLRKQAGVPISYSNQQLGGYVNSLLPGLVGDPTLTNNMVQRIRGNSAKITNALTSAARTQRIQLNNQYKNNTSSYRSALGGGDILGAVTTWNNSSPAQRAAILRTTNAPTKWQRLRAGADAANSGYGKYLLANAIGGPMGLYSVAAMDGLTALGRTAGGRMGRGIVTAGKVIGYGGVAIGAGYALARGAVGLARKGGDLLGLNQDTLQNYMEFDKALKLATNNLKAGLGGSEWAALSPGVTDRMKVVDRKLKNAAMSLAAQYGGAGNATDVGNLFRAMSGLGGLRPGVAQDVIDVSRTAMKLSMVSEETTPEEAGRGIMSIYNAAQGVGVKGLSPDQIAASMYKAGALSPLMVSDLTKNASNIAVTMAGGASLSEALSSYMLMTSLGYTGARAGTQMSSLRLRMPSILAKKGFANILGVSSKELTNLSPMEFIQKLTSQANREKLNTAYGISGGTNPLTQRSVLNDVGLILQETFGLRGGQFATLLEKTVNDPDNMAKFQNWIDMLSNSAGVVDTFNNAVREVNKGMSNRMANAQNAIENLKFEIWGVLAPWVSLSAGGFALEAEKARVEAGMKAGTITAETGLATLKDIEARRLDLEDPGALYKEQQSTYGGGMLGSFVELGKVIYDFISKLTAQDIADGINAIGWLVKDVASALAWLYSVLLGAARAVAGLPFFGDPKYAAMDTTLKELFPNKTEGERAAFMGSLTEEQRRDMQDKAYVLQEAETGKNIRAPEWMLSAAGLPTQTEMANIVPKLQQGFIDAFSSYEKNKKTTTIINVNGVTVGTVTTTEGQTISVGDATTPVKQDPRILR